MNTSLFKRAMTPVMLAGLLGSVSAFGATVNLGSLLVNSSFESPTSAGFPPVCPTNWTCTGSPTPGFGTYTVTNLNYTPGADGLSGGRVTPDGAQAAFSPTTIEGTGDLTQSITGLTYIAGNTYTYSFYVGQPLTEPDDVNCQGVNPGSGPCPVTGFPTTAQLYFTANGVQSTLPSFTLTDPGSGQWLQLTESFTAAAGAPYLGQTVGVDFHVAGGGNQVSINLDAVPTVPEPASLLLGGLGIAGLGLLRRKRSA